MWLTLAAAVALGGIVLLAAGLPGLDLRPAERFSFQSEPGETEVEVGTGEIYPAEVALSQRMLRVAFLLMAALLPLTIIALLLSPEGRRTLLRWLLLLALLLGIAWLRSGRPEPAAVPAGTPAPLVEGEAEELSTVTVVASSPPSWLAGGIRIGLILLILGLAWLLWRRFASASRPGASLPAEIADRAQHALAALQEGADLRDTVLRCYHDMNRVLAQARGITRPDHLTPREFEQRLALLGLPEGPVRGLTRLFEAVRYGDRSSGAGEQGQALACLEAIVEACGMTEGAKASPDGRRWATGNGRCPAEGLQ